MHKLVLVGDGCVGKTTWITKIMDGTFIQMYGATLGVEVTPLYVNGNKFNVWDTAGKYKGLGDGYYKCAQCAIVMCNNETNQIQWYIDNLRRMCSNIPIIIVCNNNNANVHLPSFDLPIFYIDVKNDSEENLLVPFVHLTNML